MLDKFFFCVDEMCSNLPDINCIQMNTRINYRSTLEGNISKSVPSARWLLLLLFLVHAVSVPEAEVKQTVWVVRVVVIVLVEVEELMVAKNNLAFL